MTSGPSLEGVDQIRQAAAYLKPYQTPVRKKRWPKWLTAKRFALLLVADLIVGSVGWHYLTKPHPAAEAAAVQTVANAAAHNDWSAVYDNLCSSDRSQVTEANLHDAGRAALLAIGELDHVTVTSTTPVTVPVGPLDWPAAEVSGQLVPVIGTPSPYTVTVVREASGWHMCLSVGGYSSAAMGVAVPLGSGQLAF